jgi:hypothetical protein
MKARGSKRVSSVLVNIAHLLHHGCSNCRTSRRSDRCSPNAPALVTAPPRLRGFSRLVGINPHARRRGAERGRRRGL